MWVSSEESEGTKEDFLFLGRKLEKLKELAFQLKEEESQLKEMVSQLKKYLVQLKKKEEEESQLVVQLKKAKELVQLQKEVWEMGTEED